VGLKERFRCVKFAMNPDRLSSFMWPPKNFVRFEMKMGMGGRSSNLLPDHRHQPAMMKDSRVKLFWPRMQHPFVKRDVNLDWRFDPVSAILFTRPVVPIIRILEALSTQLGINELPILGHNILWTKGRVSDYLKEILEA
jgi:hypothetical protein